jgi:hypothetical protein
MNKGIRPLIKSFQQNPLLQLHQQLQFLKKSNWGIIIPVIFLGFFFSISQKSFAQNTLDNAGLSSLSPSEAAYSLRKLSSTYSGFAIRVRRNSDNTLQDIGFTAGGDLDTTALKTFTGAASGFIAIWYDQSGNGRNATQSTTASQPRIINAGVLEIQNGRPAIRFSGSQNMLTTLTAVQATTAGNTTTANAVFTSSTVNSSILSNNASSATNRYNIHAPWGDGRTYLDIGDNSTGGRISATLTWGSLSVGTFQRNNTTGNIWKNGLNIVTSSAMASTVTSTNALYIGSFQAAGTYMTGSMPELIVFASAVSTAERQALECNQFSYYSISDAMPPVVTCPATQSITLDASCTAVLPDYTSLAAASDNCTAAGSIVITQSPVAGTSVSGAGVQIVTLTATDAAGNSGTCTFNVNKLDITPPVITCPSNITVNTTAGTCGAVVNYAVTATDNCSGSTGCVPSSMPGYILVGTYGGHTYYRSTFSANWTTANTNSNALGGHLLTLSSAGENALFNGLGSHWSGFTDQAVEGTWVWVTGEPVVFTNWAPAEPNDFGGNEDYQQLNWNAAFNWNDYNGATNYPYIVEFDCAAPTLNLISGFASGSTFPTGNTTVTYNATDNSGNTSSNCSFTVTVNDITPPTILCPGNINVNAAAGACDVMVNYNTPLVIEGCANCGTAPAISGFTYLGAFNGATYYISNTTANGPAAFASTALLGATVPSVNSATENTFIRNAATAAGFGVTYFIGVNDVATEGSFVGYSGEALSYTNWNTNEPNNSGNEDYVQVLTNGLWNDITGTNSYNYIIRFNCLAPVRTSGLASGSTFPFGTSTINYSATDPSGNTSNCSFTVTVSANPASLTRAVTAAAATICAGTGTNINVALSDNGISYQLRNNADNSAVGSPVTGTGGTINLPTGNLSSTTTFNVFSTGSSCSYQLTSTVTVTVNPAATVIPGSALAACQSATPAAITLSGASVGGGAATGAWSITAGGGTLSSTAQTATPATVTYTPAANFSGTVTLTLTTNDPAGPCGALSATRTITVNALPTNITPVASATSVCSSSSTDIQIPASQLGVDYQLRNNTGNVNIGTAVAGTGGTINLPTGNLTANTTFNVLATNATTSCSRQLTTTVTVVMDNVPPVITCPGAQTISLDASCAAVMPDYTTMTVVLDNCTPTGSIVVTQSPLAGTALSLAGTQTITLTATDANGNNSNCTFILTKQDVTPPVITCPANVVVNASTSMCGAVVNYTVAATDNCSGSSACAPSSIPGYTLIGTYGGHTYFRSNTSSLWPAANTSATSLGAHLVTISSAGENAFLSGIGQHWGGMTDEVTEGTWVWANGEPVVYTSWTSSQPDNSGNQDYLVLNFSGTNWDDQGTTTTGSQRSVIEFDCAPPTMNLISGLASGSTFPTGTTTVTYNATDASGNTSSNCSFTVTVNDVTPPTITCPANITVNTPAGACTATVNYNTPVATDNCGSCSIAPAITGFTSLGIYGGNAYYVSNSAVTASAAFAAATVAGGNMTTVSSAAENTFIRSNANSAGFAGSLLIGINDVATEGSFVWASGETSSYTNWNGGEPNNSGGNEDYAVILNTGLWNDVSSGSAANYVMEVACITPVLTSGLTSGSSFPLGVNTINYSATDPSGNVSNCSFTVTVSLNPASLNRTVAAASTNVCINNGTNITVALSDNGISYQLRNNADNSTVGSPVTGTGGTINLPTGNLTATTTFNVFATGSSCSYQLSNTATVTVIPLPTDRTPTAVASAVCSGTGTNIQITTSQSGVNYQLRNNATNANVGASVAGTGGTINLATGNLTANTTFNVLATTATASCGIQMLNTVTVTVNPLPGTPAGSNASRCGTGTVTISATPGAGETIDWFAAASGGTALVTGNTSYTTPSISVTTLYYAQARNTTTGCVSAARRTVTATINAVPASPTAGNNSRCGTGTVAITSTPGAGETIDWYSAASGGTALVTGNTSYTTPSISSTTSYFAQARNTTTGCLAAARTTVTATINAIPLNKTISAAAASVCSGSSTNIQVASSENGVNYQLRNNTGNVNIGSPVAGTGGTINLPTGNLAAATTFNVLATNAITGCNLQMTGTVTVNINPLPTDKTPTALSSSICSGTDATIQIAASQSGVSYQLRNNTGNTNMGSAVAGTGGTITLLSGAITANTTFNVLATNTTTSCAVQMVNTVSVTVNPTGQWIGGSSGNWNTATNWCGGVPTSSTNVIIPASTTVNIQSANALANSVTIAATGNLVMTGAHNLTITAGGTFTNNGTFTATASTGTVAFLGSGTISGTTTFNNIDTYGALDFGTASTVSGIFSIQTGGSVTGNSPTYTCPTAILAYKPGSTFTRGLEWTNSSSGAGYPANVVVQNNTTINFPSSGDGYICYDLTIDNGSSLRQDYSGGSAALRVGRNVNITGTLALGSNNGGDIYVGGNWVRNTGGVFTANDRKVTFDGPANFSGNGTSMSTITAPASSAKDNEGGFGGEKFDHIWIDKTAATDSVVLLSNITVTRELGLTRGTFSLRNSDVTIVSNDTRTADVAPVTTPADIAVRYAGNGRFVIQRFIHNPTNVRSWRLMGVPLQSTTAPTINQAWQSGVVNPDKTNPNGSGGIYNPWPGYGTHITGPGGVYSAANGWDHGTNSASVLYTNNGITTWFAPSSTTATKVTDQQGWMLFVRGDRGFAIGNQYVPSQNTILEPKGKINIGNVTIPVAAGKQVIANPYPSAISLINTDVAGATGGNSNYYMWDPKFHTSYTQPGKWVTFSGVGSSYVQTTSQSAYLANGTIESGQAFVLDVAAAGDIVFHETDKLALTSSLTGITSGTASRPMASPNFGKFRSDLYVASNNTFKLTDAVLNIFDDSFDNNTNTDDAAKLISFNTKESLSILRDSAKLAIEKRKNITQADTIFFATSKLNELPYRFRFAASNFAPGLQAYLEDKFINTRTEINMEDTTVIDFTITADSLSKATDRFRVVFRNNFVVLPVTFTNVSANQQSKDIAVQWNVANEINVKQYEVEKSLDGSHFEKTNTTMAAQTNTYNWLDENAVAGDNYYRIRCIETNGSKQYSKVVKVNIGKVKGTVSVYPNPVSGGTIKLKFANMKQGNYTARLFSTNGQLVLEKEIEHSGVNTIHQLQAAIFKGTYNLELSNNGEEKIVIKVIME